MSPTVLRGHVACPRGGKHPQECPLGLTLPSTVLPEAGAACGGQAEATGPVDGFVIQIRSEQARRWPPHLCGLQALLLALRRCRWEAQADPCRLPSGRGRRCAEGGWPRVGTDA